MASAPQPGKPPSVWLRRGHCDTARSPRRQHNGQIHFGHTRVQSAAYHLGYRAVRGELAHRVRMQRVVRGKVKAAAIPPAPEGGRSARQSRYADRETVRDALSGDRPSLPLRVLPGYFEQELENRPGFHQGAGSLRRRPRGGDQEARPKGTTLFYRWENAPAAGGGPKVPQIRFSSFPILVQ